MPIKKLPVFKGYTVDARLRQFRKLNESESLFIDFRSPIGEDLLTEYIQSLGPKSKEFKEFINYF